MAIFKILAVLRSTFKILAVLNCLFAYFPLLILICREEQAKIRAKQRNWDDLGVDLASMIEERIVLYVDQVRFRAVCKSWYSLSPELPNLKNNRVPWLIYRIYDYKETSHGLFNPLENEVYLLNLPTEKIEGKDISVFVSSCNEWVVTMPLCSDLVHVWNPLTGFQIELPPLILNDYTGRCRVDKVIVSSSLLKDDCVVFAIYDYDRLAYCKLKDNKWLSLVDRHYLMIDIMFHKEKLYILSYGGEVLALENTNPIKFTQIAFPIEEYVNSNDGKEWYFFFMESSYGELILVVLPYCGCRGECTENSATEMCICRVYKHDPENLSWCKVESIGDEVIFLQETSSTSISCRDYHGFKGNRIYSNGYVPCYLRDKTYVGFFDLGNGTFESLSPLPDGYSPAFPLWFIPMS